MKVADITDLKVLDRLVAECRGWEAKGNAWRSTDEPFCLHWVCDYTPTTNRAQWAELVEEFKIELEFTCDGCVAVLQSSYDKYQSGPTPGIAVCKAFIVSVMGEEVDCD